MSEVTLATATKEQLLEAAAKLDIAVDGRWGDDRIREEIQKELDERKVLKDAADANAARIAENEAAEKSKLPSLADQLAADQASALAEKEVPADETPNQKRLRIRREATALVRVHISCMDPAKNKHKGELLCVSNRNFGSIQRFIPFNRDWHIEKVLLDHLLDKEYMVFDSEKTGRAGIEVKTPRQVKAYNVRILPSLTEQELKDLAQRQAMADGTKG